MTGQEADAPRYLAALGVGLIGVTMFAVNWYIILSWVMFRRRIGSWCPVVGGVGLSAAIALLPQPGWHRWWWVPLLLDWGSLPGIVHSVGFILWDWVRTRLRS